MYDVLIIGAGCVGAALARELSKFQLKIAVLDKESDVSCGASKANSGIVHGGYDARPGTVKAKLSKRGNESFRSLSKELNFEFKMCGSYVLAFDEEDEETLLKLYNNGIKNGIEGLEIVGREHVLAHERNVNPTVKSALFCKTAGIVSPYEYTIALMENAVDNGVKLFLNTEVLDVKRMGELIYIRTNKGAFQAKFVINAAGIYSDKISSMAAKTDFKIIPRRGEYMLFDKLEGGKARSVLFQTPKQGSKGVLVTPTAHHNLLIGPSADFIESKIDTSTTAQVLSSVLKAASLSVPNLDKSKIITQFSGLRASTESGDFIIGETETKNFINAAAIDSPGLTTSYAIAEMIRDLLAQKTELKKREDFDPYRTPIVSTKDLSRAELNSLIETEPAYGNIVCRCEQITEGEIVAAVRRSIPALDVDAVKRRVRAGMGRCQGGFCMPKVMEIIARESGKHMENITKKGNGSEILIGELYPREPA